MTFLHVIDVHSGNRPVLVAALLVLFAIFIAGLSVAQAPVAAQPASPSGLRLVGTVESATFSGAVLDDGKGIQTFYGLLDALPDGSRIIKVRSDSILLKQSDGSLYDLFIIGGTRQAVTARSPDDETSRTDVNPSTEQGKGYQRPPRRGRR